MKPIHLFIIAAMLIGLSASSYSQFDDIYKKVKKEVEKTLKSDTAGKKTETQKKSTSPDTLFVSDYHRTHKGEIAFCKERNVDLGKEIGFESVFNEKDLVTGCVYLDKRLDRIKTSGDNGTYNSYFVISYVDGQKMDDHFDVNMSHGDFAAFVMKVIGRDGGIVTNTSGFSNMLIKMNPGEHKIKVEVYGGSINGYKTSSPIASGEFTLIKNEPEKEKTYGKWSDVVAGMSNSNLERQAIDAVNRKAEAEGWKERYSKAKITSYDWITIRNEWTGIITGREIDMTLYGTWPDGTCRKVEFGFWEDYNGSSYSNVLYYNGIGGMYLIECE